MKIGELARQTGVSERMLRFYEEQGLLSPVRTAAGYRQYAETDVARVAKIRLLQRAGLAVKEVARLLDCLGPAPLCDELRARLRACRAENRARLAQLAETEALLARLLGESPAGA